MLTDIHTHDSVNINVYSVTIFNKYHRLLFSRLVLDEMGCKPGLTFLFFKAVLQL